MLRKNRNTSSGIASSGYNPNAGMPIQADYYPQNMYKPVGDRGPMLDVTDPFARMNPNNIPVPGTSVWINKEAGPSPMGNAYDMMGMLSSFDTKQRNTINPLELYSCQNEGPSVLHPEVQPIYEGCRRLILNGKQDVGYCQYKDKVINFGRLFLDKETYEFPYIFQGYKKSEISVFLVKYRTPNIILQLEPIKEFNDQLFAIGQFCKSHSVVMNYFYIAWAYIKNKDQMIVDFKTL